ncbi:MAG TPA: nucleotide exchange factor GrpE, partial [Anaerolineae bacterium]
MTDEEPVEEKPNEARNGSEEAVLEVEHTEIIEEVDPVKALTDELTQTKAQAAEYLDGWQRARAEFANYKRRTEAERAELIVSAG